MNGQPRVKGKCVVCRTVFWDNLLDESLDLCEACAYNLNREETE